MGVSPFLAESDIAVAVSAGVEVGHIITHSGYLKPGIRQADGQPGSVGRGDGCIQHDVRLIGGTLFSGDDDHAGPKAQVNLLGAYVHTNRLQYVEFFGKFYEGGGRPFNPFCIKTNYVEIKEEN